MKKIRLVNFHFHVLHNVPFMSFMISRKMFNKMCNTLIPAEQYFSSSSPKKWRQMSRFNTHLPKSIIIYFNPKFYEISSTKKSTLYSYKWKIIEHHFNPREGAGLRKWRKRLYLKFSQVGGGFTEQRRQFWADRDARSFAVTPLKSSLGIKEIYIFSYTDLHSAHSWIDKQELIAGGIVWSSHVLHGKCKYTLK